MAGTREGGLKAAARNRELYGKDFYKRIGTKGGQAGNSGGFASALVGKDGLTGRERARVAGVEGGKRSKRTKKVAKKTVNHKEKLETFTSHKTDGMEYEELRGSSKYSLFRHMKAGDE